MGVFLLAPATPERTRAIALPSKGVRAFDGFATEGGRRGSDRRGSFANAAAIDPRRGAVEKTDAGSAAAAGFEDAGGGVVRMS